MNKIMKNIVREIIKLIIILTVVFIVGGIDDIADKVFNLLGM